MYLQWASLLVCISSVAALYSTDAGLSYPDLTSKRQITSLAAITVRSSSLKRGVVADFKPGFECAHHYADHNSILRGDHSRFATTSMKYRLPTIVLEDIELGVKDIVCSESAIVINFPSERVLKEAKREWKGLGKFLVISSHVGCNGEGARAPYLVSNVEYNSKNNVAMLSVRRIEWADAYDTMEVRFGMGRYEKTSVRTHNDLRRRDTSAASPTSITTVSASVSSSETVSFPSAPTSTPTSNTSVHDIDYQVPAGFSLASFSVPSGATKETLTMKCSNCSLTGSIQITQGVFTVSNSSLEIEKAVNFFKQGFFDAVADGLGAHIEIDTSIAGTFTESFEQSLMTPLALPGFQIPEIAAIGPMWVPTIKGSISVSSNLDFKYGFEVDVPSNSSVRLNIGNLTESSTQGFSNASVNALPLTSTDPSIALTLSLALQSQILLGVDILNGRGKINSGAFLSLPSLSVSITQLSAVDSKCDPIINNSTSEFLGNIFPSLTNIVPKADIGVGLEAGASITADEIGFVETVGTTATLAGTSFSLPTACLSFDSSQKAYVSPTVSSSTGTNTGTGAAASATSSSTTDDKKKTSAAVQTRPPSSYTSIYWTTGMLVSVLSVALSL